MKRLVLPEPPNPSDPRYNNNPMAYSRDLYGYIQKLTGKLEQLSQNNDRPIKPPFIISSYSTNTELTGTSTGTDLANFICTLIQGFIDQGIITVTTATG